MAYASNGIPGLASVLVHMDLGPYAPSRAKLALALSDRFGARLTGAAAQAMLTPVYGDMTPNVTVFAADEERRRVEEDIAAAKRAFDQATGGRNDVRWTSDMADPDRHIVKQARSADLIVLGRRATYDVADPALGVSPGYVALEAGRPILVVPPEREELLARRVVVAWKDTREARRAVRDALPILKAADEVLVVAAGESLRDEGAEDVADHLRLHKVDARPMLRAGETNSIAQELLDVASDFGADLIVSGAYGHSRTREWFFGGATRDLLETSGVCLLMSH
ncbi:universal stress protein [Methylopila musalis]|uniref:Universal stress protein n=1 Tax=Methylopila musalis TaxID=1134781 RepID=A0ABW3Z945_9HYPH